MKDLDGSKVRSFFKWISASIQAGSAAVTDSGDCFSKHEMPDAEIDNVKKIDPEDYKPNGLQKPAPRPAPGPAPGPVPRPAPNPVPQADPWRDPVKGFKTIIQGGVYVAGIDFPPGYIRLEIQNRKHLRYYRDDFSIYYTIFSKADHIIESGFFFRQRHLLYGAGTESGSRRGRNH